MQIPILRMPIVARRVEYFNNFFFDFQIQFLKNRVFIPQKQNQFP